MKGKQFFELYGGKADVRCLDYYGNHPEKDAVMLVGILAGLLFEREKLEKKIGIFFGSVFFFCRFAYWNTGCVVFSLRLSATLFRIVRQFTSGVQSTILHTHPFCRRDLLINYIFNNKFANKITIFIL